jgi:hypothetical protein
MRIISLLLLLVVLSDQAFTQTSGKVEEDDQGIALDLLVNLNIPAGFIVSPTLNYRTRIRPLNRPIHFFINPNMGLTQASDAERDEGSDKYKFGFSPEASVGYPIFYNAEYRLANALKGTEFESGAAGNQTTYYVQSGYVPTHQALLAEIGYVKYQEYDYYGPSVFYGLRWYITQKGKIDSGDGDGSYYAIKQVMSLYFYLYNRLNSESVFENLPEDRIRRTGYKFGVDYTRGGRWGMKIAMGGCPGKKDLKGGEGVSWFLGYFDVGIYKVIGLWKAPL